MIIIQEERVTRDKVRQVEEGTTYSTAVSHVNEADAEEIPSVPNCPHRANSEFTRSDLVVFDLETTGLG